MHVGGGTKQSSGLIRTQDDGQPLRSTRTPNLLHPRPLDIQHAFVENEECCKCLLVSGG